MRLISRHIPSECVLKSRNTSRMIIRMNKLQFPNVKLIIQFCRNVKCDGALIVTTPQAVAVDDVLREVTFCRKTGIHIFGIIENMSGFVCPSCSVSIDTHAIIYTTVEHSFDIHFFCNKIFITGMYKYIFGGWRNSPFENGKCTIFSKSSHRSTGWEASAYRTECPGHIT